MVRFSSVRTLQAIAAREGHLVHQMDVRTAFLNGILEEEVYTDQPEGFVDRENKSWVCRLLKTIYGLKQSARGWNRRIHKYLIRCGFEQSKIDSNMYIYTKGDKIAYLALYVDDTLIIASSSQMLQTVKKLLSSEFCMTDLGQLSFFLGMQAEVDKEMGIISIHQKHYVRKLLEKFGMHDSKPAATPEVADLIWSKEHAPRNEEEHK